MKLRVRRRRPEEPIEGLLPSFLDDGHHARHPREWRDDAFDLVAAREEREFVRSCIDALPEAYRTVLVLRDIEEMETAAVARLLGVTENLVKVRLHRARQALRTLLEPRYQKGSA
jgi:RNA polymerase sigma-70 factor (ECF subfamily)